MKTTLRGFSLVETVMVTALVVLVGLALSGMIQFFYRTNAYVLQESAAVQSARLGLATAVQNLREASYGDDGSYPIASAASSTITFYADVNGDGKVDMIQYFVSNGTLYRGVTNSTGNPATYAGQPVATTTVAKYIRNTAATPIFQYYDNTGTVIAAPVNVSTIASVAVTILVDVDPNRSPSPYSLLGSATLRNLGN